MAKNIDTGIHRLMHAKTETERQYELFVRQWRDLRNKLDSSLLSSHILSSNDCRVACAILDGMDTATRIQHVKDNWGIQALTKAEPLIQQLASIEEAMASAEAIIKSELPKSATVLSGDDL